MRDELDDADFDPAPGEDEVSDPDTNLILDYLSNRLDPADVRKLETRARSDKDFRYKLADIVLLKGLVMLALEKNPGPAAKECRKTQRLFLDYLKGRTNPANTAMLSRHLEECFECELAFERFQEKPETAQDHQRGRLRRSTPFLRRPRKVALTAMVAVALAAGAMGIVGMLASAGKPVRNGAVDPGTAAEAATDGLMLHPGE